MAKNSNLNMAATAKNDEFYTQFIDIENELRHYREHFSGKVVLCNCDDPSVSAFWRYFHLNFEFLGLKKLVSTHYSITEPTYKMEYTGGNDEEVEKGVRTRLEGSGDFRSEECIDILKEADIVVTNPPFSLFLDYVAQLIEYNKKFLIIGNMNATNYLIPYMRGNKLWVGVNEKGGTRTGNTMLFAVADDYAGKTEIKDGIMVAKVAAWWYTNLDFSKRHNPLLLWKSYTPEEYPHYDNYNAIECGRSNQVPCDYDGVIGVPISFLNGFYCPEQFEIVGITYSTDTSEEVEKLRTDYRHRHAGIINGKEKYPRILIRKRQSN